MTKPFFAQCFVYGVCYPRGNGKIYRNWPVNLSLCTTIQKDYAELRTTEGYERFPSILFLGCDTRWYYETEYQRDDDFDLLVSCLTTD